MNVLQKTITSLEVAEMVGRNHSDVLRDLRKIISHLAKSKNALSEYFIESTYKDTTGRTLPNFLLTKKGCELYATRMTGERGTQFAVAYIERFNEMEKHIEKQQLPQMSQAELIAAMAQHNVEQEKRITAVEQQQENITNIIKLNNSKKWREETNKIINTIARNNGGTYKQTRQESYARLETRARCDLEARLRNKTYRLQAQGAPKRTINNLNYLDVISDDDRLIEIYLSIVKEMAVEHNVEKAI